MLQELLFYAWLPVRTKRTVRRCLDTLEAAATEGSEQVGKIRELRKAKDFDLQGMIDLATALHVETEKCWNDLRWLAQSHKRREVILRLQERKHFNRPTA